MRDWRVLHQFILKQSDGALLEKLAYELEAAIFVRLRELDHQPSHPERAELRSAIGDLYSIRIDKLGWPDPRKFPWQLHSK